MTTVGTNPAIAALSRAKSRMSPCMDRMAFATFACSKRFGWVGGSSEYPITSASSAFNQSESQLPLKPVCPVRKTRRPFQNERFSMIGLGPADYEITVARQGESPMRSDLTEPRRDLHWISPAITCRIGVAWEFGIASGHRAFCSRHSSLIRLAAGALTSSNESTASFETFRRITQPSERAIGRADVARAAVV